jgi:hypothetical protein
VVVGVVAVVLGAVVVPGPYVVPGPAVVSGTAVAAGPADVPGPADAPGPAVAAVGGGRVVVVGGRVVVVVTFLGHSPLSSPCRLRACLRSTCALLTSAVTLPVEVPLNERSGLEK